MGSWIVWAELKGWAILRWLKCSVEIHLDFGSCRVLSLDSLIKAKEAMGRPRDKEAVLQLKAVRDSVAD